MARDYKPVPQLSEKLDQLFEHADFVYRRHHKQVERGVTYLSVAIGLRESYLSDHKADDELREPVERALLLRYGIGPIESLRTLALSAEEHVATSRAGLVTELWESFHRAWPHWREGDDRAFNRNLIKLDPKPLHLDEEPLCSAISAVKRLISRRRSSPDVSSRLERHSERSDESIANDLSETKSPTHNRAEPVEASKNEEQGPFSNAVLLSRAFFYAASLSTIPRASGAPTISHLMQVAGIVLENGGSEDEAVAGFLHDAAEDYGENQLAEIARIFNENVSNIIRDCSDSYKKPGIHREPWFPRKKEFLEKLPGKSVSAMRVIVADKLHNARAMLRDGRAEGDDLWAKLKRTPEETTAYFAVAHRILAARHPSAATAELGLVVAMLESSFCNPSLLGEKITAFSRHVRW
jgi:hypothetical protein